LAENPVSTKVYLQPEGMVFGTILDLAEMQGAKVALSDARQGKIHFTVELYGSRYWYCFSVSDIGSKRCRVRLVIEGTEVVQDKEIMLRRQFALLDSMLAINADMEFDGADIESKN